MLFQISGFYYTLASKAKDLCETIKEKGEDIFPPSGMQPEF